MSLTAGTLPVIGDGPAEERRAFLKQAILLTVGGLFIASLMGVLSAFFVAPMVFQSIGGLGAILVIFGGWFLVNTVFRNMVYGRMKWLGFIGGAAIEGLMFGFLLLITVAKLGVDNGMLLVAEAMGLTFLTVLGLFVYSWFSTGELSLVRAGLAMTSLPMLLLMFSLPFLPIGGLLGVALAAVFVLVSAAGLLYQIHKITISSN